MLTKTGFAVALVVSLVSAGLVGALPASAQMSNEQQVVNQRGGDSGAGILINEVEINPRGRDAGKDWVELYNPTSSDVNISSFAIQTLFQSFTITIPTGTVMQANQFYIVKAEGKGFGTVERLTLVDPAGKKVDSTPSLLDRHNDGRTWQRIPDSASTWRFTAATQGQPNASTRYQEPYARNLAPAVDETSTAPTPRCLGLMLCIEGKVFKIVDTDTLYVRAGEDVYKVDLSLTKINRNGRTYENGSIITMRFCLGSDVLVDQDDGQPKVKKIYGVDNIVATVYCSSHNLNEELLDSGFVGLNYRQCYLSEFAHQEWAMHHGCK